MIKDEYSVIGLMSGTSLDGLDLAHVVFRRAEGKWTFQLLNKQSLEYDQKLVHQLKSSVDLSATELLSFDKAYGKWLGKQVGDFMSDRKISVDFVSSHGHTVFHQIDKKLSYQIGDGQTLANACGHMVINDFRSLDVSLGGQGAPLVPIGDMLLFNQYDYCLNLGGIANISFHQNGTRIAFDITVANMLLNHLIAGPSRHSYDRNGELARSGQKNDRLFEELNQLEYCLAPYPKSTGYEWFVEEVLPVVEASSISTADKLCTSVHHTAYQISRQIPVIDTTSQLQMLTTGGGTKNQFLFDTLQSYLPNSIQLIHPGEDLVDFKESIVFALMGVLRMRGEVNCLASVTGASDDNCGGQIYYPGGVSQWSSTQLPFHGI